MSKKDIKKGDYVKITKIGCYGEYISYISIVSNYDEENNILHEIVSCLDTNDPNEFIELVDKKEYTEQEELVNDMMMLIASFSGKVYSMRAKENKKKQKLK